MRSRKRRTSIAIKTEPACKEEKPLLKRLFLAPFVSRRNVMNFDYNRGKTGLFIILIVFFYEAEKEWNFSIESKGEYRVLQGLLRKFIRLYSL